MSGTNGSYAMGIVGVQKGYGKIRWLDMLGHRIFPRHFWVSKVQQLATAQSMHSMFFFGTNGLNKVYTVFRPSVFVIIKCSLCSFFMPIPAYSYLSLHNSFFISGLGVQVSKFVQSLVQILRLLCCIRPGKYG